MYGLLIVIFLLDCVALVISILLQSAKGEGLAGAFGGSSLTGTVFGGRGAASLTFNRRMGGVYGAATWVAMLGLVSGRPDLGAGDRVGVYAYGSGSCAEFYTVLLEAQARDVVAEADLERRLNARVVVDVPTYEACERHLHASLCARDHEPDAALVPGLWDQTYAGRGRLVLRRISDYRREYVWS